MKNIGIIPFNSLPIIVHLTFVSEDSDTVRFYEIDTEQRVSHVRSLKTVWTQAPI